MVVPAKRLDGAKTRLAPASAAGDASAHRDLVLALLADTLTAAVACVDVGCVGGVLVVTDDPAAGALAVRLGARTVPDEPDGGLNAALAHAAATARRGGATAVATLNSDVAALRPAELTAALTAAAGHRRAFVADHDGSGTTLLTARGVTLEPRFGRGSAAAHEASGAVRLGGAWPGLALDVDTEADLAAARRLGLGAHTTAWLARAGATAAPVTCAD